MKSYLVFHCMTVHVFLVMLYDILPDYITLYCIKVYWVKIYNIFYNIILKENMGLK